MTAVPGKKEKCSWETNKKTTPLTTLLGREHSEHSCHQGGTFDKE